MKADSVYSDGAKRLLATAAEIAGSATKPPRFSPLFGDGSDRRFFRIFTGDTTFVGLVSPRTRIDSVDENDSYLSIGRHLRSKGIPVPEIVFSDAQNGLFLLEDAGDFHLQGYVLRNPHGLEKTYRHVLLMLASLHRLAPEGFSTGFCFDTQIYDPPFIFERELEYFRKSFLNAYLHLDVDPARLRADFERLAEDAGTREKHFVFHRDFQSRNIMVRSNRLRLLDFQGMRFGPPAYDLASLLIDPYVKLPCPLQSKLAGLYWSAARRFLGCTATEFFKTYRAVRLCRNLQILGAFGFLGLVKGKTYFLDYIPWAWEQLRAWLTGPCRGRYPGLEKLVVSSGKPPLRVKNDKS